MSHPVEEDCHRSSSTFAYPGYVASLPKVRRVQALGPAQAGGLKYGIVFTARSYGADFSQQLRRNNR